MCLCTCVYEWLFYIFQCLLWRSGNTPTTLCSIQRILHLFRTAVSRGRVVNRRECGKKPEVLMPARNQTGASPTVWCLGCGKFSFHLQCPWRYSKHRRWALGLRRAAWAQVRHLNTNVSLCKQILTPHLLHLEHCWLPAFCLWPEIAVELRPRWFSSCLLSGPDWRACRTLQCSSQLCCVNLPEPSPRFEARWEWQVQGEI